ncbi:MAG: hypothetical protein JWR63_1074 [Conexibacter sp.]|nr:hypothetical protein [Conexibacter sp.]
MLVSSWDAPRTFHHVDSPEGKPWARAYARLEPQGDAGDLVQVNGLQTFATADAMTNDVKLVVSSLEFGAVAEDWTGPTVLFDTLDEFLAEYRKADDAEIEAYNLAQHAAGLSAAEANEGRESPWAFTRPDSKRPRSRRDPAPKKTPDEIRKAAEA